LEQKGILLVAVIGTRRSAAVQAFRNAITAIELNDNLTSMVAREPYCTVFENSEKLLKMNQLRAKEKNSLAELCLLFKD
jgi:hypothetical protein